MKNIFSDERIRENPLLLFPLVWGIVIIAFGPLLVGVFFFQQFGNDASMSFMAMWMGILFLWATSEVKFKDEKYKAFVKVYAYCMIAFGLSQLINSITGFSL